MTIKKKNPPPKKVQLIPGTDTKELVQSSETIVPVLKKVEVPEYLKEIGMPVAAQGQLAIALKLQELIDPVEGERKLGNDLFSVLRDLYIDSTGRLDFSNFVTSYRQAANALRG